MANGACLNRYVILDRVERPELLVLRVVVGRRHHGHYEDGAQNSHALDPTLGGIAVETHL